MTIAAVVVGAIGLAVLVSAIVLSQKARSAAYFGLRQDARKSAARRLTGALVLLTLAGGLFGLHFVTPDLSLAGISWPISLDAAVPEVAIAEATASIAEPPAATSVPTSAPVTPTSTVTPTARPGPTASPSGNTRLSLQMLATGVDAKGRPLEEGSRFSARTKTVYVFYNYRDVPPSASIRHTWFHNGGSVYFENSPFTGKNGVGVASISWTPPGGFEPGLYEVRIVLGNVPQFVANFEVR